MQCPNCGEYLNNIVTSEDECGVHIEQGECDNCGWWQ